MNIPLLLFVALILLFLQGMVVVKWGLSKIEYSRKFSQSVAFEGEMIEMIDEIANRKLLPVPWLRLESKIDENLVFNQIEGTNRGDMHLTLFSLMPFQKIKRRQKVTCAKRGYYGLETVSISTGDAVGFGETFQTFRSVTNLTVYPKIIDMEEIPLPSQSWLGDIITKRWIIEDPFVMSGIREYTTGDPMHTVNWKATARTGSLQVSKKDFTADHHLMIYLNFDQTEDKWLPIINEEILERGLSYAASIAHHTLSQGIPTGFGCNSYLVTSDDKKKSIKLYPATGKVQLNVLLEYMGKAAMANSSSFYEFLEEDVENRLEQTDILLITSTVTEKMQDQINLLERRGNKIEVLWLEEYPPEKRR